MVDQRDRAGRALRHRDGHGIYFEAAILIAMVGFVSTVAYCRFLLRGDIIE